jgi:hypothetical protein
LRTTLFKCGLTLAPVNPLQLPNGNHFNRLFNLTELTSAANFFGRQSGLDLFAGATNGEADLVSYCLFDSLFTCNFTAFNDAFQASSNTPLTSPTLTAHQSINTSVGFVNTHRRLNSYEQLIAAGNNQQSAQISATLASCSCSSSAAQFVVPAAAASAATAAASAASAASVVPTPPYCFILAEHAASNKHEVAEVG